MRGYRFDVEFTYNGDTQPGLQEQKAAEVAQYVTHNHTCDPMVETDIVVGREENSYGASRIGDWWKISVKLIFAGAQVDNSFDPDGFRMDLEEAFRSRDENFERVEERSINTI